MSKRAQTSGNEDSPAKIPKPTSICEYCNKTFTSRGLSLHQRKCSKKLTHEKNEAKKTRAYKFCILNEYIHEEILSFLSNQTLTKMQMITGDHYEGCEPELAKICCKCENDNFTVALRWCRQCLPHDWSTVSREIVSKEMAKIIYGVTGKDLAALAYRRPMGGCIYERATLEKFVLQSCGSKKEWLRRLVKVRERWEKAEAAKTRRKQIRRFLVYRAPELAGITDYKDLKVEDQEEWYPRFVDIKACVTKNVCGF
ncbi:hypothetical protein DVH05_009505 [Phytophthora capsici]|nr:hypothetical protein DVH05_009505 [Phytophthora capsici]